MNDDAIQVLGRKAPDVFVDRQPPGALWAWFSDDSLKFMFAAWFLAPELLYSYGDADFFRWTTKIGDFFKAVSCLQECCRSAAYWAGRQLQIHGASVEVEVVGLERSSHRATM